MQDSDDEGLKEEEVGEYEKESTWENFQVAGLLREMRMEQRQHKRTTEAKMVKVQRLVYYYLLGAAIMSYKAVSELREKFKQLYAGRQDFTVAEAQRTASLLRRKRVLPRNFFAWYSLLMNNWHTVRQKTRPEWAKFKESVRLWGETYMTKEYKREEGRR